MRYAYGRIPRSYSVRHSALHCTLLHTTGCLLLYMPLSFAGLGVGSFELRLLFIFNIFKDLYIIFSLLISCQIFNTRICEDGGLLACDDVYLPTSFSKSCMTVRQLSVFQSDDM
jgi:hypothetical protein